MTKSEGGDGFDELAQPQFVEDTLGALSDLHELVLEAYGYRCALTGERFQSNRGALHPDLDVVAIRPLGAGGTVSIGNCLPLTHLASRAFRAGQIIITDDYGFIADFKVLNTDLARRLRPDAQLVLPPDPAFWPNRTCLAFHRRSVLGT